MDSPEEVTVVDINRKIRVPLDGSKMVEPVLAEAVKMAAAQMTPASNEALEEQG